MSTWINAPGNTVTDLNYAYVDQFLSKGMGAADSVINAANTIAAIGLNDPDFSSIITPDFLIPDISGFTIPNAPIKPIIPDVVVGNVPIAPTLTISQIAPDNQTANLIASMITILMLRLNNPTGLSPEVETALFQRGVDRETALMRTGYQNYIDNNSSVGWSVAPGQDQSAFIDFEKNRQSKLSDINRDIMIKQADMESTNVRHALDSLNTIEQSLAGLKQADETNKIKLYDTEVQVWKDQIQVQIDVIRVIIDAWAKEADVYVSTGQVTVEQAKLLMAQVDAVNNSYKYMNDVSIKKLQVMEEHEKSKAGIAIEGEKAIAATLGQLMASLFNAFNLSASFGHSISWSGSESVST